MIFDWMDCAAILSARNVLEGETFRAFVINELTEEVLEQHAFTPLKNRLGQYQWVSDFCRFINNRSNVVQAGLWENGKWIIHGSSYQNRIWSTLKDIRVFTNSPDKDNWIKSTAIHSQVSLKATDKVHVVVRSERSGRRFELVEFRPLAKRLAASQWRADLVNHINTHSQYIKAGSSDDSKHVITTSAQTDGNCIWLPKGSGITASWYICESTAVADVVSGRNAFEKERITVFVVDDVSDQERDKITLETPAADTEMRTWTTALCKKVNAKSEYVKAGTYNESGQFSVISGSSFKNRIWTEHRDIRVFTTCPRLDNWEPIKPLLTDEVMTLDERVIVKVRSAATGRLCETLVFAPSKDRLKPALWMRDLSTLINEQSLYLRAGQANAEKELIETIADVYKSFIWAPKNSRLNVTWERCQLQPTAVIRSQRNPVENEKVRLFVLDEASGKELERREYTVPKAQTSNSYDWVEGFCNLINSNSKLVRIGESFKEGKLEVLRSGFKNRIWPLGKDLRAFTTSIGLENWVAVRDFSFETDLKANDRIVVHLRSELTGYLYERYSFSPTLKDKKATAADWTKALCEKLNKECIYLKAGWKNEEKQIIEPVADHRKNVIWVPVNSGLTVEVLNIADKTRHAAPIEVQENIDPATGQLRAKIPLGTLVASEGRGPSIELGLEWSADHAWTLSGVSYFYCSGIVRDYECLSCTLHLSTGEVTNFNVERAWRVIEFPTFRLEQENNEIKVIHKSGVVETLRHHDKYDAYLKEHALRAFVRATQSLVATINSGYAQPFEDIALGGSLFELADAAAKVPGASIPRSLRTQLETLTPGWYSEFNVAEDMGKVMRLDVVDDEAWAGVGWAVVGSDAVGQQLSEVCKFSVYLPEVVTNGTNGRAALSWRKYDSKMLKNCLNTPVVSMLETVSSNATVLLESGLDGEVLSFVLHPKRTEKTAYKLYFTLDEFGVPARGGQLYARMSKTYISSIERATCAGNTRLSLSYLQKTKTRPRPLLSSTASTRKIQRFDYRDDKVICDLEQFLGAESVMSTYLYEKDKTKLEVKCGSSLRTTQLYYVGGVLQKKIETQGECSTTTEYSSSTNKDKNTVKLEAKITLKKGKETLEKKSISVLDCYGNLVETEENKTHTYWTYYPGTPETKEILTQTDVTQVSGLMDVIGWGLDNLTVLGLANRLLRDKGLTWGKVTSHTEKLVPRETKHEKATFNLPVDIELGCPGDANFFTTYVESETSWGFGSDGQCDNLCLKLHGYTALSQLPSDDPLKNKPDTVTAIRPTVTLTVLRPQSKLATNKLLSFQNDSMTLEKTTYITDLASPHFGRLMKQESCFIDDKGKDVSRTRYETSYSYIYDDSKATLETTITETVGGKLTTTHKFARNIITGRRLRATDVHKSQTTWDYDDHGRLISEVEDAQDSKKSQKTRLQYHSFHKGHTVTTFKPGGDENRVEYDVAGNQTKVWTRGAGFIGWRLLSSTVFDDAGRPSVLTDYDYFPDGTFFSKQEQRLHYDDWGNLICIERPDGTLAYSEHDPIKRQTLEYVKAGGKIREKVLSTFNEQGKLTRQELQDSAGTVQAWVEDTYDAGGWLIKSKDSHGAETSYTYDPRGRVLSVTEYGIVTSNTYPAHSELASKVEVSKGKEAAIELGSRTMNLLSGVTQTRVGGRKINYEYKDNNPIGKRTTGTPTLAEAFTKHSVEHEFTTYPGIGAVVETHVVNKEESSVTHVYSLMGKALSFTDAFGQKTVYHYDAGGRRIKALSDEVHNTFTYDAFGTLTGETVWRIPEYSSVKISYTHDALGQETSRSFVIDDKHKLNLKYTYDKGRIKTAQVLNGTTSVSKEDYAYDEQGRLKTWTCDGTQRPTDPWLKETLKKQSFTYDVLGNIKTCISETTGEKKTNTATYAYSDTDKAQPIKISHSEKSCTAVDFTYDAEGRLSKNPVNKLDLHYDQDGRQVGSSEKHLAYYDSFGRRVRNEDHYYGEWFYYNGNAPYARKGAVRIGDKKTCDHRRTVLLNQSGSCVAQQQTLGGGGDAEINTFELKDVRGSVIASWRTGKESFEFLPFTPYGYRPSKEDDLHWLGFTGQPLDRQSGVYHLGNGYRAYDPVTQVFHAPDNPGFSPFGDGGANWYAYCAGDPINMVDPSGHSRIVAQWQTMEDGPLLANPAFREVFGAVMSMALAPLAGGGAAITAGLMGIALLQGASGAGAVLLQDGHPDASTALRLLQGGLIAVDMLGATGLAGGGASTYSAGRGNSATFSGGTRGKVDVGVDTPFGTLYNNPSSNRLVINAHGGAKAASKRVDMPAGIDMKFYGNKGSIFAVTRKPNALIDVVKNGPRGGRAGKFNVPDYNLSAITDKFMKPFYFDKEQKVSAELLKNTIDRSFQSAAILGDASILRITNNVKLSEVIAWVASQQTYRFSSIEGFFCRGGLPCSLSHKWLKRLRATGIHRWW